MIHAQYDLDHWLELAREFDDPYDLSHGPACSPLQIASVELRRQAIQQAGGDLGDAVKTDVFVWHKGEPDDRRATKIGGLPFWPASEPWPCLIEDNSPLSFVGQFNFSDSRDLVGDVADTVLLVFASSELGDEPIWYVPRVRLSHTELIAPRDVPDGRWRLEPLCGCIHRTREYPNPDRDAIQQLKLPFIPGPEFNLNATKIKGVWDFNGEIIEPEEGQDRGWYDECLAAEKTARENFLCQFSTMFPSQRWPFLNVETLVDEDFVDRELLTIFDCGRMMFFFDEQEAEIEWSFDSM